MPDFDPSINSVPPVRDRTTRPPGVLPRNAQTWLIGGIALLMVVIIAFSGRNDPKNRKASLPTSSPAVVDPDAVRIQEYRARIEEQSQKLAAEQTQLARTRQGLGLSPEATSSPLAAPYTGLGYPAGSAPTRYGTYSGNGGDRSWVEVEKEKREYLSLFASNVALTYRKGASDAAEPSPTNPGAETTSALISPYAVPYFQPFVTAGGPPEMRPPQASAVQGAPTENTSGQQPALSAGAQSQGEEASSDEGSAKAQRPPDYSDLNRASGKLYRLLEGTVIETVLTNRLDGEFSGPVNCMVTTNVYAHDHQRLLIPQGSRVFGEVRKVATFGQQRLAVVFHRLTMPDGYSVSLDKLQGLNQIGETGLVDQINHHYLQVFGISLAIGAIAGLSAANTQYGLNTSAADAYRQGMATSLSQSSMDILDRYLNVLPTFTIREGYRVKIYLTDDLTLPAYDKHQMPSDL